MSLADLVTQPDLLQQRHGGDRPASHMRATKLQALDGLAAASDQMGTDAAAFVSFSRDDPSHESFRFLLACDPVWCLEYERRAWYTNDPWLQYSLTHSEPARGARHRARFRTAARRGGTGCAVRLPIRVDRAGPIKRRTVASRRAVPGFISTRILRRRRLPDR